MNYQGDYLEDATIYLMFNTFTSDDPSASSTITNFVNTDVHIHKDDGLTQRNNAAGITVSVNFDGITGSHMIKIDTSDDTVAGFWVTGKDYFVRIEGTIVDAGTINAVVGHFSIENRFKEVDLTHIMGTILTEGDAGRLSAAFIKLLDVATPLLVASEVMRGTDSAALAATALSTATWTAARAGYIDNINGHIAQTADHTAGIADIPTVAEFNARSLPSADYTIVSDLGTVQTGDSYTRIGANGAGLTNINLPNQTMDIVGDITGNLSGSVGSLTGHTVQTGDTYALANGVTGFVVIDTVVDAIKAITDNLPDSGALTTIGTDTARLTAARAAVLTDWINGGRLDLLLDAVKVVTDALTAAAATKLAISAGTILSGTAQTGTLSTTEMTTNLTISVNDQFNGRIIIFNGDTTTAALRRQATDITDSVTTDGKLTFTAITTAPVNGDTFIIV